jgi:hypothetical protein
MLRPAEDASASSRLANARSASLIPRHPGDWGDLQPYRSHTATALATAKSVVLQAICGVSPNRFA